jgi:gentisate 1,2-dioxygenase
MAIKVETTPALEEYYVHLEQLNLRPLWLNPTAVSSEPDTRVRPCLWKWKTLKENLERAGELIEVGREEAERRVLSLVNPTLPGPITTRTLSAAVQMIYPGERAPSHRHTAAAIRFVVEGSGAYTIVNGEPLTMEPGDFILTPNWTWHGHAKEGTGPIFWMDSLDAPLVRGMNWMFYEEYPTGIQSPEYERDDSLRRFSVGGLRPAAPWREGTRYSPLFRYPWEEARAALDRFAAFEPSPYDGVVVEYTNPNTGGPVMPTMSASLQLLQPGQATQAHRHTTSVIYHVAEGSGWSVLEGERYPWSKHDIFCVPSWVSHQHGADAEGPAVLFALTDAPVLAALDLYREQALPAD